MIRALSLLDDGHPSGLALVESQLLGALILCPLLRLDCGTLRPQDFSSPDRGAAFGAVMLERHPELGLVVDRLERDRIPPPENRTGWGDALARLLGVAFVEDEAIPEAVRRIKEAAAIRRLSALSRGPDGT